MKNTSKPYSVKMYAEMKLDDGRVLATEDEQFMIGSKVFVVSDEGDASPLEAGSYTLEDGAKITIDENSKILDLGEEKEAEDVEKPEEASEEKELAEDDEADVGDWAGMEKRIKNLEDAVADLKADKEEASAELSEETNEETTEEGKEELSEEKENPIELSSDFASELVTRLEGLENKNKDLENKLEELSKEPADEGINYSPQGNNVNSTVELNGLSSQERAAYYINNLK